MALEQGREVFAIPGSIHNPLAKGCHALIRQGAKLVETAEDIMEELCGQMEGLRSGAGLAAETTEFDSRTGDTQPLDEDYRRLLDIMGYDPVSIDTLIQHTGLTSQAVSSMLLLLELEGYVSSAAGGRYYRTEKI
jgi:DNA processing protein